MKKLVLVLSFPAFGLSATAHAHFNLVAPPPNTTTTDGGMSSPPCGVGTASGVVTSAQGGHPLTVKIDEFVPHTGFYRIALAVNSPSELPLDPVVQDAMNNILPPSGKPSALSARAACSASPVFPLLQDNLFHHKANGEQMFQVDITLPNINCTKCTLQVLEFMEGHGFNFATPPDTGPGGGYFYRHCADLKITADASMPLMGAGGTAGASAGGSSSLFCDGSVGGAASSAGGTGGVAAGGGGVSATGGSSANGGGVSASGGLSASGGVSASGGGVSASGGGGAPGSVGVGAGGGGGAAAGGTSVTSSAGSSAAAAPDSGGCSFSLGKRSAPSKPIGLMLFGLFVVALRRRQRTLPQRVN